jgi:hypothetical protein
MYFSQETETIHLYWTQLSRFHLKKETIQSVKEWTIHNVHDRNSYINILSRSRNLEIQG